MSKSVLVGKLDIQSKEELDKLIETSKPELKAVAYNVIFDGNSYKESGRQFGISKAAVYEFLKRIYYKKYMVEYGEKI